MNGQVMNVTHSFTLALSHIYASSCETKNHIKHIIFSQRYGLSWYNAKVYRSTVWL